MIRKSLTRALLLAMTLLTGSATHATAAQAPCTPGISFWKLLESVNVSYTSGMLEVGKLYAVCLPAPTRRSASNYPYDPDGGGRISTLVKTGDGKLLNTYVWYAESIAGLWELSSYKVVGGSQSIKALSPGNYLLEFAIDDKPFYRFPFSVTEMKNDDPYQPAGSRYFIDGPWNEYGNIFFQRNDPESTLRFTTWLQEKSGHASKASVSSEIKLIRLNDGKVLGTAADPLRLQTRWLKADFSFSPAGGDKNSYLKAADLLREDGRYNIRLNIDGKLYGEYPFSVKDGKIQLQGKQIREKTEAMVYLVDYLGGGRYTSWWITREIK